MWKHEPKMSGLLTFQEKPEIQTSTGKLQCFNAENYLSFFKHCVCKNTYMHTYLWVRFSLRASSLRTLPYTISYKRRETFNVMPKHSSLTKEDRKGETCAIGPVRKCPRDCHLKAISGSRIQRECLFKGPKPFHKSKGERDAYCWSRWSNRD